MVETTAEPPPAKVGAIVVAAGRGERFRDSGKILRDVAGCPMFLWAVRAVAAVAGRVVVVTRQDLLGCVRRLMEVEMPGSARFGVAAGGEHRQDSVEAGLAALAAAEPEIVTVLDAARPLTTPELVRATVDSALRWGSGVAGRRIPDTVKEADDAGFVARTLDRTRLWRVETPQTFRADLLRRALHHVRASGIAVTDDAGAVELLGAPVRLVDSCPWGPNDKATVPEDLSGIDWALRRRRAAGRLRSADLGV